MVDRWRVLAAALATRSRRFGTRAQLERHQQRRLQRVLNRARRVYPFYAAARTSLADFPVLDKATWLRHFDGLNDRGLDLAQCLAAARAAEADRSFEATLKGVSIGLSSGTSGQQGVFLTTPAEQARWAGVMLAKALPSLREPARVALVLRSGGPLYQAVHGGRITFCYVDLALPPDAIAERLQAFAPTVLAAPPQVLDDLAARRSRVSRPDLAPHTIYSIADVLDDDVAARVASGFGCPARQIYQATEGFLGISCEHGTLHLNEDMVHVEREVIDQSSGRFTPVITDLYRTTQAIIRYRLNDVLLPGVPECPCGSAFATVARVEGRADDVLWLPDQAGATRPLFADFVRNAVLAAPGVHDFRLVQRLDGSLGLAVRPSNAQASAHRALQRLLRSRGFAEPAISGRPWPVESSLDKRRRVRRER